MNVGQARPVELTSDKIVVPPTARCQLSEAYKKLAVQKSKLQGTLFDREMELETLKIEIHKLKGGDFTSLIKDAGQPRPLELQPDKVFVPSTARGRLNFVYRELAVELSKLEGTLFDRDVELEYLKMQLMFLNVQHFLRTASDFNYWQDKRP